MKYFVDEASRKASQSTCYFEFQKGCCKGKCWLQDSISISADLWDKYNLSALFSGVIEDFDYFGITTVTKNQWDKIVKNSKEAGTQWQNIVAEAIPWVNVCFEKYDVFSVLGI